SPPAGGFAGRWALHPPEPLVDVLALEVRIDRFGPAEERRATCGRIGNRVARSRVEVVAEALHLSAEGPDVDVHRDGLVEAAVVRVDLAPVVPGHVPDEPHARCPVLIQLERRLVVPVADVLAFPADAA